MVGCLSSLLTVLQNICGGVTLSPSDLISSSVSFKLGIPLGVFPPNLLVRYFNLFGWPTSVTLFF